MASHAGLRCDGCGQIASPEHVAQRLRRLEWATRYRPVHIRTLLLGAFAPSKDSEFLYAPGGEFQGEAAFLLRAVGISPGGRSAEAVQAELQAAGFFLTHVLECPLENGSDATTATTELLRERLPFAASRIRRSLKPRRVILVTEALEPLVENILALELGCPVVLDDRKPFYFSASASERELSRFRELIGELGNAR